MEDVEALAGAVDKAGDVPARGAVFEEDRDFERFDPGGEQVQGHADLGAEAGSDTG